MAVPSNTFKTFEQIGAREDLSDIIYNITPTETPFMSNAGKGKAFNTFHEWQTDVFTPVASNAHLEGDDSAATAVVPTVRFGNHTQIAKETARVSDTASSMNTAGRANEMSYQVALKSKKLKRDVEITICGMQPAVAGAAGTARESAGFGIWGYTNVQALGAGAVIPTNASGAPLVAHTAGTPGAFDETDLKAGLKACWDEGGNPNMVCVNSTNKQLISGFSGIATQYRDNAGSTSPATIIGSADVYVSDFGQVNIVASRDMPTTAVYMLDTSCVSVDYLRGFETTDLAKTGDSTVKQILTEFTLRVDSPDANSVAITTL